MGDSVPPDELPAGARDREAALTTLQRAMDEGRLSPAEYEDRARAANAARTFGELAAVTADLPAAPAPADREDRPEQDAGSQNESGELAAARAAGTLELVRGWFIVSFLSFAVWLVLAINQGFDQVHPWWIWVAGGWGAALFGVHIARKRWSPPPRVEGGEPRGIDDGADPP